MSETNTTTNTPVEAPAQTSSTVATGNVAVAHERDARDSANRGQRGGKGGRPGGKGGARPPRAPREKPEFDSKTISIRRVTRVDPGGRRFILSVARVVGERHGRIGLGT